MRRIDGSKRPRRLARAGIEAMRQWLALLRKALEKNYHRHDVEKSGKSVTSGRMAKAAASTSPANSWNLSHMS